MKLTSIDRREEEKNIEAFSLQIDLFTSIPSIVCIAL